MCFWCCHRVKHMLGYDDSLDVFGVHCTGGIVGALLTGVFAYGPLTGNRCQSGRQSRRPGAALDPVPGRRRYADL